MTRPDLKLPGRHVGIISDPPSISQRDSIHFSCMPGYICELIKKWNDRLLARSSDRETFDSDSLRIFKKVLNVRHGKFQIHEVQVSGREGAIMNAWGQRMFERQSKHAYQFR